MLDQLDVPIVLAPLAGGPSTPELAAAVSNAGGLGFLGAGYLSAEALAERIRATRALTDHPIAVNLFVIDGEPADASTYNDFVAALGPGAGEPRFDDDEFDAKVDALVADPVEVVSFTFGVPKADAIRRIRAAGSEVWITATMSGEVIAANDAGADVIVLQGSEAGGHRGSFGDHDNLMALTGLLSLASQATRKPVVAAGGIARPDHVEEAFAGGAKAVAAGTAFMLAPEAGTSPVHREAIRSPTPTALTRAFTGRLARGIRNRFMLDHPDAPSAYPQIHYATAPIRAAARERGDADLINLWAGVRHAQAVERPAAETVRALAGAR